MTLKPTKISDIKRVWHLIDAKGQILGRLTTVITGLLMGKTKPYFVRHLDCGDYVVVVNAKEVKVTGKKEKQKQYYRYSGYPGGLKAETMKQLRQRYPEKIIYEAVKGMLPQNKYQ
jgi:large subunit ribosomal protein L13